MLREYTRITCSNGHDIRAQIEEREDGTRQIYSAEGAACPKGRTYVEQEVTAPQRNIAISILVKGGILPLASVKLTDPIPRDRILDTMDEIKECTLTAPVKAGTVIIPHLLGYNADVIVTRPAPGNGYR